VVVPERESMTKRDPDNDLRAETILTEGPRCPDCGSEALYRYGRIHTGKPRFLCLSCNRQFVLKPFRERAASAPVCPKCGRKMHVCNRNDDEIRYRCARYPECRTFIKIAKKENARDGA
jgi:transposase-like protein